MTEIVIGAPTFRALSTGLSAEAERAAALYLSYDAESDRYLVRSVEIADELDRLSATEIDITLCPLFLTRITRRARDRGWHLALMHTHPHGCADFSIIDDHAERDLAQFMHARNPTRQTFSMVLCGDKIKARRFGTSETISVRRIGPDVAISRDDASDPDNNRERYDRQVRAFGVKGQAALRRLTIAIVGLGGTGSLAAQQLVHLGVGSFVLIDPDVVEQSNLNRVVGAVAVSLGQNKVNVAADLIGQVNPRAQITRCAKSVISEEARRLLCSADCIFICTDSHVSRAFLSEFCYQYMIPGFDVGVSINAMDGTIRAITGRTQMLAPGLPCLLCSNALDARIIREELMTPEQRAADPYFNDGEIWAAGSHISKWHNGIVVHHDVPLCFYRNTGARKMAILRRAERNRAALSTQPDPECAICGAEGLTASGDSRVLTLLAAGSI